MAVCSGSDPGVYDEETLAHEVSRLHHRSPPRWRHSSARRRHRYRWDISNTHKACLDPRPTSFAALLERAWVRRGWTREAVSAFKKPQPTTLVALVRHGPPSRNAYQVNGTLALCSSSRLDDHGLRLRDMSIYCSSSMRRLDFHSHGVFPLCYSRLHDSEYHTTLHP